MKGQQCKNLGISLIKIWTAASLKIVGTPFCVVKLIGPGVSSTL